MEVSLLLYWAIMLQQWIRKKSEKWPRMLETQIAAPVWVELILFGDN